VDLVPNIAGITTLIIMEVPIFLIISTMIRIQDMVVTAEENEEDEDLSLLSAEDRTPTTSTNVRRELREKEKDK
jgi:hypothetical protein